MTEQFCKLYEDHEVGQILVTLETDGDGCPAIFIKFKPSGLGVCQLVLSYTDSDESVGWEKAEKVFTGIDKDGWTGVIKAALSSVEGS